MVSERIPRRLIRRPMMRDLGSGSGGRSGQAAADFEPLIGNALRGTNRGNQSAICASRASKPAESAFGGMLAIPALSGNKADVAESDVIHARSDLATFNDIYCLHRLGGKIDPNAWKRLKIRIKSSTTCIIRG